jgi:beta-xylosidase
MRSRSPLGPYEVRTVMAQGRTPVNGPHQGAWVELPNGEGWFVHFQDRGPYGRVVHLQPLVWKDGWPVIGSDPDGDGTGEPVLEHRKPDVGRTYPVAAPQTSDEFEGPRLGLQWQWHANDQPGWFSLTARRGALRLFAQPLRHPDANLWAVPNLLLQKLPAPAFTATAKLTASAAAPGETFGLVVMGLDYAYLAVRRTATGYELVQARAKDVDRGAREETAPPVALAASTVHLRVAVRDSARCQFSYSLDGRRFVAIGEPFQAREGRWIGAKVGLFALTPHHAARADGNAERGHADIDFFRVH